MTGQTVQPTRPFVSRYQPPSQPLMAPGSRDLTPAAVPGFVVGCVYMFFLFSRISEFVDTTGRLHLVMIFAALGIFAVLTAGTFASMLTSKPGAILTIFTLWLTFSLPFSSWKGGSVSNFSNTWLKSYVSFFIVGGLIFSLSQLRKSFFWMGAGVTVVVYAALAHRGAVADDRLTVSYGTLGNSNDLAATLLLGLPFVTHVITDSKRNAFIRIVFVAIAVATLGAVMKTGSRSGLVTVAVMSLLVFLQVSVANKAKLIVCGLLVMACVPFVVSKEVRDRYATIFKSEGTTENTRSAIESTNARKELMRIGVKLTLMHPVFGVGLGQFANQSANLMISEGLNPMWFTSHDVYLLVAGETGVPGLLIYLAILISCLSTAIQAGRGVRRIPELSEISRMSFTLTMVLASYLVSGIFSTNAYSFQLPLFAGLAVALQRISGPLIEAAKSKQGFPVAMQTHPFQMGQGIPRRPAISGPAYQNPL